jgi:hypothetical protein
MVASTSCPTALSHSFCYPTVPLSSPSKPPMDASSRESIMDSSRQWDKKWMRPCCGSIKFLWDNLSQRCYISSTFPELRIGKFLWVVLPSSGKSPFRFPRGPFPPPFCCPCEIRENSSLCLEEVFSHLNRV